MLGTLALIGFALAVVLVAWAWLRR